VKRASARHWRRRLATLVLLCGGVSPALQAAEPFQWPRGAKLAVSLGYDDALASQLDHALPALDRHGLKASFYLTLGSDALAKRLPEWRRAAVQGHELGNHTLFHPCSRTAAPDRSWVAPHRDLDRMALQAWLEEVKLANSFLQSLDGQAQRTMTLPCGDTRVGGQPVLPAIAGWFVAIKSRGGGFTPDVTTAAAADIGVDVPVDVSGEHLIEHVKRAAAASNGRALLSLTFHGIGGDHLAISTAAHEALLKHLAAHPDRYWVESFVRIMQHAQRAGR